MSENDLYFGSIEDLLDETIEVEKAVSPETPHITDSIKEHIENPPLIREMLEEIDRVDEYAWARGEMGLDFGIEFLNKALRGFNPGLHIIAGGQNTGKSAFLLNVLWKVALLNQYQNEEHPKKAFCLYFSLDDTNTELMPRIVAMDQQITINHVLFPKSLNSQELIRKREEGLNKLKANIHHFAMKDANNGSSIETIEETIIAYKEMLETMAPDTYQIVVFIDNFHDITTTKEGYQEDNARFDYVSGKLTDIANEHLLPVMCSAEFRKINAHKRPQEDDIKSTGKISYESKCTILVYNEVGIKKDNANVYWELTDSSYPDGSRKMPVFEMDMTKNKFGSYKGVGFMRFIPEMATFIEATEDESQQYKQMMRN